MTHKRIKRFQIDVQFKDNAQLISLKPQYEILLTHDMRSKGYIRVLDMDPAFSVEFNGETWKFLMTLHGIYVGKKRAWQLEGTTQNKLIPRITPQHTLSR